MPNLQSKPERYAVSAIIRRQDRLLVIRRSQQVIAPGLYCFPGGGVEAGESEGVALRREMLEELGVEATAVRRVWRCVTPWQVDVAWWTAKLATDAVLVPNPAEVESLDWLTLAEMAALGDLLLVSNRQFLDAIEQGVIDLTL